MNPTLYVPNPMEGWGVPSRNEMEGQERRVCFCSGVEMLLLLDDIMCWCWRLEEMAGRLTKAMLRDARLTVLAARLGRRGVVAAMDVAAVAKRRDRALSATFMEDMGVVVRCEIDLLDCRSMLP
mmetsp:Transcript_164/g.372  ORF Transcript_164/g.372 Transcript_164/m.372 type:complete len:124 (+) Transcript_164:1118-1489(+)